MSVYLTRIGTVDIQEFFSSESSASASESSEATATKNQIPIIDRALNLVKLEEPHRKEVAFNLEKTWDQFLNSIENSPEFLARFLVSRLVGEEKAGWTFLIKKMKEEKDETVREKIRMTCFCLQRYPEMVKPFPDQQEILDRELKDIHSPIPDDNYWKQIQITDKEIPHLIEKVVEFSLLISDENLSHIWERARFDQMSQEKTGLLLVCLLYFPPRFFKNRFAEIFDYELLEDLFFQKPVLTLMRIVYFYKEMSETPELYEGGSHQTVLSDSLLLKGVFNLVWSKHKELTDHQLQFWALSMSSPLELQKIAFEVNARHRNWDEEAFRQMLSPLFLKDGLAIHLSNEVVERYFQDARFKCFCEQDFEGIKTLFLTIFFNFQKAFPLFGSPALMEMSQSQKVDLLLTASLFFLCYEKWPVPFDEKSLSVALEIERKIPEGLVSEDRALLSLTFRDTLSSFIKNIADTLKVLQSNDPVQFSVYHAFLRRALRLLNKEQVVVFMANAQSLSNNHRGPKGYKEATALWYLLREVDNGERWFKENPNIFEKMMEYPMLFRSQGKMIIENLVPLYRLYLQICPKKTNWIVKAIIHYVNEGGLSKEVMKQALSCLDKDNLNLEALKRTIRPGEDLLALLERVEMLAGNIGNQRHLLIEWANAILEQSCDDDLYWNKAYQSFKLIASKVPPSLRKRKKRKKTKSFQQVFQPVGNQFLQKINETNNSEQALAKMIQKKRDEVRLQLVSTFEVPLQLSRAQYDEILQMHVDCDFQATLPELYESLEAEERINALGSLKDIILAVPSTMEDCAALFAKELIKLEGIKKASHLTLQLTGMESRVLEEAKSKSAEIIVRVELVRKALLEKIDLIRTEREFQKEKGRLLSLNQESHTRTFALLIADQTLGEDRWRGERMRSLDQAKDPESLKKAERKAQKLWNRSGQHFAAAIHSEAEKRLPKIETREVRIIKHQQQEIEKLKEMVKKQDQVKTTLEQEVEYFRARAQHPDLLEKKAPVLEKPVREQLCEKLRRLSRFSPECKEALSMIDQEGKILSDVSDIVKFLGLFKIEYKRTKGNHKIFENGPIMVVNSNHGNESEPEEVKDALNAVLQLISEN